MSAARLIPRQPATVTALPTAARRPVRQPTPRPGPKRPAWGSKLARQLAAEMPTQRPFYVGTTFDPETFDDLTFVAVHGWSGDNRSAWDRYIVAADKMLRARGLVVVGADTLFVAPGSARVVWLYRNGDDGDRAVVGDYLRCAREATAKGRAFLRRIVG